ADLLPCLRPIPAPAPVDQRIPPSRQLQWLKMPSIVCGSCLWTSFLSCRISHSSYIYSFSYEFVDGWAIQGMKSYADILRQPRLYPPSCSSIFRGKTSEDLGARRPASHTGGGNDHGIAVPTSPERPLHSVVEDKPILFLYISFYYVRRGRDSNQSSRRYLQHVF